MPNDNRFAFITSEDYVVYDDEPVSLESGEDLCAEYNSLWDSYDLQPPQDREDFMNWYLARCLEVSNGMSSREVQTAMRDAEDVWRFVSGGERGFIELVERDQKWSRTYINALDRRKGNAVVAVTIRC